MDSVVFDVAARPYLIFVMNAVNAVRVQILVECKKIPEEPEKYCFWQFCHKFTHFPSVKFSGLKMCAYKKMTNIRYVKGRVKNPSHGICP